MAKKPIRLTSVQLYDRHGNKVYPPNASAYSTTWDIDCGIYQEPNRWHSKSVDNPPVLLTGVWDQ